ncbi:MAG: hypothetical protein WC943_01780 [Elusimicrobiota bacterium]|jgi:tetratricopeptide (TPR) repeat protein
MRGPWWKAAFWAAYGLLLCLGLDLAVRWTGLDRRLLSPLLYYQHDQLDLHQPSKDPGRIFELRPGARTTGPRSEDPTIPGSSSYTVNSLGLRDKERPPSKPQGVKRIVVLGGSTTFGAGVRDGETFPARLEHILNKRSPGRFEVWNAGLPAYVLSQEVSLAQELVARHEPDLLIFQYMNRGRRAFLVGQDPWPYLGKDPTLFAENLRFLPASRLGRWLFQRWAFLRAAVIGLNRLPKTPRNNTLYDDDAANIAAFSEFRRQDGGEVPIVLLTLDMETPPDFESHGELVLNLFAKENLPDLPKAELFPAHPPACAFQWYAEVLAARLPAFAPSVFQGTGTLPSRSRRFDSSCGRILKDRDPGLERTNHLLSRLAAQNPGSPGLWLALADSSLRSGDLELAGSSLDRVRSLRPAASAHAAELKRLSAEMANAGPASSAAGSPGLTTLATSLLERARQALDSRDKASSLKLAAEAESFHPSDETWAGLLRLYGRLGRHSRVLEIAQRLPERWWSDPAVPLACAAAAERVGKKDEARVFLERARRLPFSEDASLEIAALEARLGDTEAALATAADLLRRKPSSSRGWILSSELAASADDCPKALAGLAEAERLLTGQGTPGTPSLDELKHRSALAYQSCREYGAASAALEDLAERNPAIAVYRKDLGVARYYQGKVKEAKADLEASIKLDPELDPAYASLAAILSMEGLGAEAAAVCRRKPGACR